MNRKITYIFIFDSQIWANLKRAGHIISWVKGTLGTSCRQSPFDITAQRRAWPCLISTYFSSLCRIYTLVVCSISQPTIWLDFSESLQNNWRRLLEHWNGVIFRTLTVFLLTVSQYLVLAWTSVDDWVYSLFCFCSSCTSMGP